MVPAFQLKNWEGKTFLSALNKVIKFKSFSCFWLVFYLRTAQGFDTISGVIIPGPVVFDVAYMGPLVGSVTLHSEFLVALLSPLGCPRLPRAFPLLSPVQTLRVNSSVLASSATPGYSVASTLLRGTPLQIWLTWTTLCLFQPCPGRNRPTYHETPQSDFPWPTVNGCGISSQPIKLAPDLMTSNLWLCGLLK